MRSVRIARADATRAREARRATFGRRAIAWALAIALGACAGACAGAATRMEGSDARARARGDARDEPYVGGSLLANVLRGDGGVGSGDFVDALWATAKALACASAACAVAAMTAERGATNGEGKRARGEGERIDGASDGGRRGDDGSPRTPESRSPRGTPRSLEEIARAKEAAKERKRRLREEQELLAKREELERAEIAQLVEAERAKREAERVAAEEERLAMKKREEEEARVAEAAAAAELEKQREQEVEALKTNKQQQPTEKSSETMTSIKVTAGGAESKKIPLPASPRKQAPAPRPSGLTLRKIPTPRMANAPKQIGAIGVRPPVPSPLPRDPPPLPKGPPPEYARPPSEINPPLPPVAPLGEVRRMSSHAIDALPASPNHSSVRVPPGFESAMPSTPLSSTSFDAAYDQWGLADGAIQSFLASTTGTDDDPFTSALRVGSDGANGGRSGYEDIFAPTTSAPAATAAAPPLPPTPHPEILAGMLGDDA